MINVQCTMFSVLITDYYSLITDNIMSLATIIKKIEEDAAIQSEELLTQAQGEAEQVITHARLKADEEAEQILHHAEQELQVLKNKQTATTLLHKRKEKLDHRQQILSDVFHEVLQRIIAVEEPEHIRSIIKTMLLSVDEERKGTLIFSKTDKTIADQAFIDDINAELARQNRTLQFTLSTKTADIERGFLVDFEDFDVNYSVERMFASVWDEVKREVSARLFGEK